VRSDGLALDLGGQKQRALLALLLLEANRVVSSDRLIDALWDEQPTPTAQKALQVYVSQLRKLLGKERLQTKPPGYVLRVEPDELDLARFRRLQAEGRLQEALALWRGPPLAEFAHDRFAQAEIARLDELWLVCLEERIDRDLARGRHGALVGELEALTNEHPLRERLLAQLLLALYRSGRQAEALETYQTARRALVDQLGIEPGQRLRELHQQILRQDRGLDYAAALGEEAQTARRTFVGRASELAELVSGLEEALAGRGRIFLLEGEPGIGKSFLADEVIREAQQRGALVLVGRCWEAGGAPAYWPWVQSLRAYVRQEDHQVLRGQLGRGATELAQILPELRDIFRDLPEPRAVESETDRFRLFDATAALLRNASESRPILLMLDDLHAADAPSLLLLQFLARELASMRMLILGAYRDVDPTPGELLASLLAEVAREPLTRRLSLVGLSEQDVAEYLELTASRLASPELVEALHEVTEGNALFVTETVRLLMVEKGRAEPAAVNVSIPQSVRDVIAQRLAHLSDECNRMLVLASALGREFAIAALASMSGLPEDELLERLDEAMTALVVSDVPGVTGRLRFAHVLIRDTLYEGLTKAGRVRLHRQAVERLEALYGEEPGPHLAELAHHAIAGSDLDRGFLYARRAGDRALALLAYEEAARLYELALEALSASGRSGDEERCELLLAFGHSQVRAGDASDAKQTFLEAAAVARRLERSEPLARAALGYGGRFVWGRAGNDDRLVPLLREALVATGDGDVELRALLMARLATALRDEPDGGPRARLSHEAVEIARRRGDPATLAYTLVARYSAIWSPGNADERLAVATELVDLAERIGAKEREVESHGFRFNALMELGEVEAAKAELATRGRLTEEMHQPGQLSVQLELESMLSLLLGRFEGAEETIQQAYELGLRTRGDQARADFELQRFVLRRAQGRLAEIEAALETCPSTFPNRPVFGCVLANLSSELARPDEARRRLAALAADEFGSLPRDGDWFFGLTLLAETCGRLGDRSFAASLYRLLLPHAEQNVSGWGSVSTGAISRYLGILASSLTRFEEAMNHFEHALDLNTHMGAKPWLAHTQNDYAQMLIARIQSRDRERAKQLLSAALATYRELGMEGYAATASVLAREAASTAAR
jgi:DNA-binding SARP family transcriptional activator/tetratricopeptide (TPR) repeat protein